MRQIRKRAAVALAVVGVLNGASRGATYFVSTTGSDTNNGAIGTPFATFTKAITTAAAGDTIYARGGTYNLASTLTIGTSKNGTAANRFNLLSYANETPVLNFGAQSVGSSNRGINLDANYWTISGLTIQYAGDNGMAISGSNNIVQRTVARMNQDSGFQIASSGGRVPSNNLLLNNDSYGNYDTAGSNRGENADGFAVKFRGLGAGNVLSGCRAWNNSDDGYDFWQAENGIVVQNCQAFRNGIETTFQGVTGTFNGDGNGLKLGHDSGTHLLKNNLVWGNPTHGIDINGNATVLEDDPPTIAHGVTILNNTAYANGGKNFHFDENPTTATPPTNHILRNNISYGGGGQTIVAGNTSDHNTWSGGGLAATSADFVSLVDPVTADGLYHPLTDRTGATTPTFATGLGVAPRAADGSLPDLGGFLRLASSSHLISQGVNVGLPYVGPAPELGAFEYVPAGNAYWGLPLGGSLEPTWNWIANLGPGPAVTSNFDLGASSSYAVNFTGNATHGASAVRSGTVTLNLAGSAYFVTGNLSVATASTLVVTNGNIVTGSLTLTGTAKLDLKNNKLIVKSTPVGSWTGGAYTGVTGMIASGRGSGAWNASGLTTSQTQATSGSGYTTLAVARASEVRGILLGATDTWGGQTVTGSDTLVMYTYGGDANLSGNVDVDDYGQIDFNSGLGGTLTGWFNGDFDYSGSVDVDDYGIIDFVISVQGPAFPIASQVVTSVPEPSAACGLAVIGMSLLSRRKRR